MLKDFQTFISRGNVLDLAIGVIIGAAFGRIVSTLVEGVIMPPFGMLFGKLDFSSLFIVLDPSRGVPESLAEAKESGIPVIAYGALINDVISFLIVAAAVFLVIRAFMRMKKKEEVVVTTKDCPFCISTIPIKATRCSHCTSTV